MTTGQRKYGGPPPGWEGNAPGNGCEVGGGGRREEQLKLLHVVHGNRIRAGKSDKLLKILVAILLIQYSSHRVIDLKYF